MFRLLRSSRRRNHLRDEVVSDVESTSSMKRFVPDTSNTCCTSPDVCHHHREQRDQQMVGRVGRDPHSRERRQAYDVRNVRPGCADLALERFGRYGHDGGDVGAGERDRKRCRVKRGGPVCSTESSERSLSSIQAGRYELSRDAGTVGTKKCCSAPGSVGFSSSTLLCGSLRPHTADARVTNAGPSCSGDKRTGQDCVANLRARSRRQEEKEREDLTRSSVGLAGATVDVRKGDEVILRHAAPEQLLVD